MTMNANELTSIDQVRNFLAGTQRVAFEVVGDKQSRYDWIWRTLVKFDYPGCNKSGNGADGHALCMQFVKHKQSLSGNHLGTLRRLKPDGQHPRWCDVRQVDMTCQRQQTGEF